MSRLSLFVLLIILIVGAIGQPGGLAVCAHGSLPVSGDAGGSDPCLEGIMGTSQAASAGVHYHYQGILLPSSPGEPAVYAIAAYFSELFSTPYTLRESPPSPPPRV